jgi:uncharacterized protein with HEPN domain
MQRDRLFIDEAISAIKKLSSLCRDQSVASLQVDEVRRDAILWNFTVLGEACSKFGAKCQFERVEWQAPVNLRNRIVHGYWSTDMLILINTAIHDLPAFQANLENVKLNLGDQSGGE